MVMPGHISRCVNADRINKCLHTKISAARLLIDILILVIVASSYADLRGGGDSQKKQPDLMKFVCGPVRTV